MDFFGLFGRFWSVSGPYGSVWPENSFVNAALTRRIDPRSPEASANIFILRIEDYVPIILVFVEFRFLRISGPWAGPMGLAHGM